MKPRIKLVTFGGIGKWVCGGVSGENPLDAYVNWIIFCEFEKSINLSKWTRVQ